MDIEVNIHGQGIQLFPGRVHATGGKFTLLSIHFMCFIILYLFYNCAECYAELREVALAEFLYRRSLQPPHPRAQG